MAQRAVRSGRRARPEGGSCRRLRLPDVRAGSEIDDLLNRWPGGALLPALEFGVLAEGVGRVGDLRYGRRCFMPPPAPEVAPMAESTTPAPAAPRVRLPAADDAVRAAGGPPPRLPPGAPVPAGDAGWWWAGCSPSAATPSPGCCARLGAGRGRLARVLPPLRRAPLRLRPADALPAAPDAAAGRGDARPTWSPLDGVVIPRHSRTMPGTGWVLAPRTAPFQRGLRRAQRFVDLCWLPLPNAQRATAGRCRCAGSRPSRPRRCPPPESPPRTEWEAGLAAPDLAAAANWTRRGGPTQRVLALGRRQPTAPRGCGRALPERVDLLARCAKNRALFALPPPARRAAGPPAQVRGAGAAPRTPGWRAGRLAARPRWRCGAGRSR